MANIGDRVGAIQSADKEEVRFFGYGTYEGETLPPPEAGYPFDFPNPTIKLDNGTMVYGFECWWASAERVAKMIGDRKIVEVVPERGKEKA